MAESPVAPNWTRRAAVVDCGTNLFTMLIADCTPSGWREEVVLRRPVFIGQGGFRTRSILPDRFARGMDALRVLHQAAANYGVDTVRVIGTSALRDALNGGEFVATLRRTLGWELEVIDGEQEAAWIHAGVALTLGETTGPALVMDIGGGSVEFIVSEFEEGTWHAKAAVSLDAGVGRLEEFGKPEDPLHAKGEERYKAFLEDVMAPAHALIEAHKPRVLVGSSGSFDTFADMLNGTVSPRVHAPGEALRLLDVAALRELHRRLIDHPLQERLGMPGMSPSRARLIPLSSMLVQHVLQKMPADAAVVRSPFALREGVMHGIWQHLCTEIGH